MTNKLKNEEDQMQDIYKVDLRCEICGLEHDPADHNVNFEFGEKKETPNGDEVDFNFEKDTTIPEG